MSDAVNPVTGRTKLHDRLLSLLMDWTTEHSVLREMVTAGLADTAGLGYLAARIGYTRKAAPGTIDPAGYISEKEAAEYVCGFLAHRDVRKRICQHTHRTYGVPYREAVRGMRQLGESLSAELEKQREAAEAERWPEEVANA